jgi:hypothetical protein
MKKLIIASILLIPFYSAADFDIKEGMALKGKIYTSKSSSKFASVEKCEAFAESKNAISSDNVAGFTYNSKQKKCTLYKKIRSMKSDSKSVSGTLK